MRHVLKMIFCAAAALAFAAHASAEILTQDDGARLERVADGVYVIIHADASDEWPHSNTGVIEGRRSLFVIDSTYLPSRARADIALIAQVTDKPVSHLATTHWHMDHNFGASAYVEAFPNLSYVVERETARMMVLNQRWYARMSTAEGSARRQGIADLEAELAGGVDEAGAPFSAEERARRERVLAQRRNELAELRDLRVISPTELFDGPRSFNFEGRRIELQTWGHGNSPSDTTYYLPRERVLFAGDLIVQAPLPFTGASYPREWAPVLRQIEAIPVNALAPGHGPVMSDHAYTAQVRTLIEGVNQQVEAALLDGKTLDQAKADILLANLRTGAWAGPDAPPEDWAVIVRVLVERAWQNIRGQEG